MPFAGFKDFKDCLKHARKKGIKNPEAWCGKIQAKVEKARKKKRSKARKRKK